MEFLQLERLVLNGEMDRAVVLHFDVLHVGGKLADVSRDGEIARAQHGAANIDAAGNRRMVGDLALEVRADQRVKVETQKLDGNLAGPVAAEANIAVNVQL